MCLIGWVAYTGVAFAEGGAGVTKEEGEKLLKGGFESIGAGRYLVRPTTDAVGALILLWDWYKRWNIGQAEMVLSLAVECGMVSESRSNISVKANPSL
jgi:hypothetical protein